MTDSVGVGGTYKTVRKQWVGVGGAWKEVAKKWVGVGGVWKLAFTNQHEVTAPDIFEQRAVGVAVSGSSTATITGGTGPFTYAWSIASGAGFTISGATTATVTATKTGTTAGAVTGTVSLTTTDTATGETDNAVINVWLENI